MSNLHQDFIKEHGIAKLGFGCMRLPTLGADNQIDIEAVKEMVDAYIQAGHNYFDTAYGYHGGTSEAAVRQAVVERYPRDSFKVVTKFPAWAAEKPEDVERIFNEQLERLGVDYVDVYLLHALNHDHNKKCEDFGAYDFCMKMKAEGKIKLFGFSFHGTTEDMRNIMEAHHEKFDIVQLMINYFDWHRGDYRDQYEIVASYKKPVISMEPVRGGILARLPESIGAMLTDADPAASHASWAIRWVADRPEIVNVLSGMSNMQQVQDNIDVIAKHTQFTPEELALTEKVAHAMIEIPRVDCTYCKYCDKCPEGIPIFDIFEMYNKFLENRSAFQLGQAYSKIDKAQNASACTACGVCVAVCPQSINIPERLKEIATLMNK
ncbi:MAG: aldo/keto reductase [Defluviitaleaceae bacterium]|nr:aldo/keto reductase [Defluviitaleaceae bacterium]